MKKILFILSVSILLLNLSACTDDFDEMNRQKGGSSVVPPGPMFTRALVTGSAMSYQAWQLLHQTSSSSWVQHWANIKPGFTGDNYEPSLGNTIWHFYYARQHFAPISLNYQTMKLINEIDGNPLQMACAKIWNVYLYHILTDSYGDIPYSEAVVSLKAKFDPQQKIYEDMLKTLSDAIQSIKENRNSGYLTFGTADVLYQGNMDKWIKFANALTLRLGLRVSNVAPELGERYISKIDLSEVISSNDESALLLTETKTNAVTHEVKNAIGFVYSWQEVRMSKTFMDYLDGTKYNGVIDPRLYQFAETTKSGVGYKGLENGQSTQSLGGDPEHFQKDYSNIGPFFNTQDYEVPLFLLTNSECQFLLAEAKHKGWLTGGNSVEEYYKEGIKTSMQQYRKFWNNSIAITAQAENDYLQAPGVVFNNSKALEQIITQKWITLYTNGQEAWSEMRRTGFPKIAPLVEAHPGNTEMPRRRLHSSNESLYNTENYNAAVSRMEGDTQYTRVWWDGGK